MHPNEEGQHDRSRRPPLIAVSFRRLFLGGLLPSRARFRFAGSLPIRLHMKVAQSRVANLSPNFRVSVEGCTPSPCPCIHVLFLPVLAQNSEELKKARDFRAITIPLPA
jgi:hypothetical protein